MNNKSEYPTATLCGSMRYYERMLKVAQDLTSDGWIVLMPFVKKGEGGTDIEMLDDMHRAKISMADRVYVVGSYIGDSTKSEIAYAKDHDIDVIRLYTAERAMAGKPARFK